MKITASDQVLTQDIEEELVLLNIQTGRYFGLQPPGHRVWQLLTELGDTELALKALGLEYAVDEDTLRRDVGDLVERLLETGLLTPGDGRA